MKKLICLLLAVVLLLSGCNFTADTDSEQELSEFAEANGLHLWDYPQDLVELLERNPETRDFVYHYPLEQDRQESIDPNDYDLSQGVPLFMQWDRRWGYLSYSGNVAGLTACGPVCLSMAAYYLTGDMAYSPEKMIEFARENNYYSTGNGSKWTLISQGAVELGFDVTELPLVESKILNHLSAGIPIICVMGPGDFTTTGHFIVMVGLQDGLIRINDPNSRANSEKLWDYDDIYDQIRNLWAIQVSD